MRSTSALLPSTLLLCASMCTEGRAGGSYPGHGARIDARTDHIKVLTYNVLGDGSIAARYSGLSGLLRESDADVIALQEATPWLYERLRSEGWFRGRYRAVPSGGPVRGMLVASKLEVISSRIVPLGGHMGRVALVCDLRAGSQLLRVADIWLDAPLRDAATRASQLDRAFALLGGAETAVLLGDFNFGDGAPAEERRLRAGFVDVFTELRPLDQGHTWDMERNPLARESSYRNEKSRRLDRILLRSSDYSAREVELIGDTPNRSIPALFPSDHFGVKATLTRRR